MDLGSLFSKVSLSASSYDWTSCLVCNVHLQLYMVLMALLVLVSILVWFGAFLFYFSGDVSTSWSLFSVSNFNFRRMSVHCTLFCRSCFYFYCNWDYNVCMGLHVTLQKNLDRYHLGYIRMFVLAFSIWLWFFISGNYAILALVCLILTGRGIQFVLLLSPWNSC